MELSLIKQADFNGVTCNFYRDFNSPEMYMTREQIGRALGYSDPRKAIEKIHKRNADRMDKYSTVTKLGTVDGKQRNVMLYSPKGVYEICRWSRQPKADAFMDWVWDVVEKLRAGTLAAPQTPDLTAIITETVRATVSECVRQLVPLLTRPEPELAPLPRPARCRHGIIYKLNDELRARVERMIMSPLYRHQDIVDMLRSEGVNVSISSISRYAKSMSEQIWEV